MCGGCASAVKRALEAQDEVELARVNYATENAVVAVKPGTAPEKLQELAEKLAGVVSAAGFPAKARGMQVLRTPSACFVPNILRYVDASRGSCRGVESQQDTSARRLCDATYAACKCLR